MRVLPPPTDDFIVRVFDTLTHFRVSAGPAKRKSPSLSENRPSRYHDRIRPGLLLILVLLIAAALTSAVFAEEITLGSGAVAKGNKVYFGNYGENPVLWRVLGPDNNTNEKTGHGMLLLSEYILGRTQFNQYDWTPEANMWENSSGEPSLAKTWCTTFYNGSFTAVEKSAVIQTEKKDDSYSGKHNNFGTSSLEYENVFFLSAQEVEDETYFSSDDSRKASFKDGSAPDYWWLRSPNTRSGFAGQVNNEGWVYAYEVTYEDGARPAFNLDLSSVFFSTLISGTAGEPGAEYKLTLIDPNRSIGIASGRTLKRISATDITVPYSITGECNHISLLIINKDDTWDSTAGWSSGSVLQYFTTAAVTGTSGTVTLSLPENYEENRNNWEVWLLAELSNGDHETDYATVPYPITIPDKIEQSVTAPTAVSNLTYTGDPLTLINAGSAGNGTMKYAVTTEDTIPADASAYTYTNSSLPTGTDAKTYYVWYMSKGNEGYNDYYCSESEYVSVTIAPADPETPTGLTATYGDTLAAVSLPSGWTWANRSASVGDAGTNTFKADYTSPDTNHNSKSDVDLSMTVSQKPVTVTADDQYKLEGDPDPEEFTAKVTDSQGQELASDIVTYSFTREGDESVGSHTIKVTGETSQGNYTVAFKNGTLTISAKDAAPITTAPEAAAGWTEDGTSHALLKTAGASDGGTFSYQVNDGGWSSDVPTAAAAGEYKIYYYIKGTGIYKDNGSESAPLGPLTVTVSEKGTPKLTAQPEGASGLEATGEMQDLLKTAGASDGGTVMYSVNGGDWSDTVPQAKDADSYEIRYYIKGTGTYKDNGSPDAPLGTLTVVITEAPEEGMDVKVNFVFLRNDSNYGLPFDIKLETLKPMLILKDGDEVISKSDPLELQLTLEKNEVPKTASFSKEADLGPGKYTVAVSGLPKEIGKEIPDGNAKDAPKYSLTSKAEINSKDGEPVITVYLIFTPPAPKVEPPVVYILPEDEIGAYAIRKDGTKEYLLFHTYDICMDWLGSDELCSGYERCFHKDGK